MPFVSKADWKLIVKWLRQAENMYEGDFYTGSDEDEKELTEIKRLNYSIRYKYKNSR
jgi:hypothetical protein